MNLTVVEWYEAAVELRARGLDALADFYAANARLVQAKQRPLWPPPPELKASAHLARKPAPGCRRARAV